MRIIERNVSITEEKRIITGLIVSTAYCRQIVRVIDFEYITNSYLQRLAKWAVEYFNKHEKAPFKHIKDIFERKAASLKDEEIELIEKLLNDLSEQYDAENVNVEYLVQCTEEYFRKRELDIHINNISVLKDEGDLDAAEDEISRFNRVSVALDDSIYINPGDPETRERLYKKRDEQQRDFFKFPGDLGDFIGNLKPGDVVGLTAPQKRGKSFELNDFMKHAIMSKRHFLKWAIEMTDVEEMERFDKMFFPTVDGEPGIYKYPAFDCLSNQIGDCGERNSSVIVRDEPDSDLIEHPDHIICTKCRDREPNRFIASVYNVSIRRDQNDIFTMRKKTKRMNKTFSKYARIVSRQKYSLTYDLMMRDLEILESRQGFIPQIIGLDYIDILQISSLHDDYRLEDEKWKLMQKLAGATGCLVITPTQANKDGNRTATLHRTDQAGFYGKGRHVNMMIGINQTPQEKRMGMWRCNLLDARSHRQNDDDCCIVLQDLKTGQMHLDSYWPGKLYNY